jgi:hypothetical protein
VVVVVVVAVVGVLGWLLSSSSPGKKRLTSPLSGWAPLVVVGGKAVADEFNTGTGGVSLGAPIGTNPGRDPVPVPPPPPPPAALVRLVIGVVAIWTLTPVDPGATGRAFGCGYARGVSSGYDDVEEEEAKSGGGRG